LSQSQAIDQLVTQAMASSLPAGQILQTFFRVNPKFGASDRARLADGFWQALRSTPFPDWLAQQIREAIGTKEFDAFVESITHPGALDLRVNLMKCKPDQAVKALQSEGIVASPSEVIPEALRVQGKPNIEKSKAYQQGLVEVQDLGSQILARLVAPKREQLIVDFCAGAGGKTLALAGALRGSGRVYALDISGARLAKLSPRLERSGLKNVWPMALGSVSDSRLARLFQKADAVLVDAPCSGTGTLRRSPDLKWRLSVQKIAEYSSLQADILRAAARLVRPGGRLVYATCSLLPSENEAVIGQFLTEHPDFRRVSAQQTLENQGVSLAPGWKAWSDRGDLTLWPHRSGTDGFYAAVMAVGG
jgi:16S rRNA (cytosine967-C5)-methyltransferase